MSTETSSSFRLWVATGVLSALAFVLGFIGYGSYLSHRSEFWYESPFDRIYYTLQLFLLDPTPLDGPPYGVALSVAMYLAPAATVLAVVATVSAAFRDRWVARWLRRRTGHTVVVGTGPEAFVLAQRLAEQAGDTAVKRFWKFWDLGNPVVLVGSGIDREVARRHDVRVVDGDPADEKTLRAAGVPGATRVFALADTGAANAGVALRVRSIRLRTQDVVVHARVDDAELVAAMRARRLGAEGDRGDERFRVDFFSIEGTAAIALLDEHPPGAAFAVVGDDRFARVVARELERRRRQSGTPTDVVPVSCADSQALAAPSGATYVCADDPDEVLRIGLHLHLAGHPRVVLCLGRRSLLASALEERLFDRVGGQLKVFGILDAACDPRRLERNALVERLARALHTRYLREYGRPDSTQPSHVPWAFLDERYRDDNREQAEDVGRKLETINAIIVPVTPGLPPFTLSDDDVEKLAELEHKRWMANKKKDNIVYGSTRTDTTHPDLLDWDDPRLSHDTKNKDRMFVRSLPDLLAAEDLAIVRRASGRDGDQASVPRPASR